MSAIIPQNSAPVSGLGSFDFQGHDATVYADDRGHWVFLNQLCSYMGIDAENQRKRINRNRWSKGWTAILAVQVPGDHQTRNHFLVHQRRLPMWLGSINTYAIKDTDVRERVQDHQDEFAEALSAYVYEGGAINPRATTTQLQGLKDKISNAEARILELEPKAHLYEILASSNLYYDFSTASNILNRDPNIHTGRTRLFKVMRDLGVLNAKNKPYSKPDVYATERPDEDEYVIVHQYDDYQDRETGETRRGRTQTCMTFKGLVKAHKALGGTQPISED